MKLFQCQNCSQMLFFENEHCESCGSRLAYMPEIGLLSVVKQDGAGWCPMAEPETTRLFCRNAEQQACNWLVPPDSTDAFCLACRHNRKVPNIAAGRNLMRWRKIELAKHHMFYTLLRLGLPLASRVEDPQFGLAFDFLEDTANDPKKRVMTGHDDGIITLNVAEADDSAREALRLSFGEPYRTLLGHFRHEIGHYFWDRLVQGQPTLEPCRATFGDERADYAEALKAYYANGATPDWQTHFVSAYASAHPWEDFAETWAHYLHIIDTLEMAHDYGVQVHPVVDAAGLPDTEIRLDSHAPGDVTKLVAAWLPLTLAVNSINRCMGQPDLYPFVLSPTVITKLGFIHDLVHGTLGLRLEAAQV